MTASFRAADDQIEFPSSTRVTALSWPRSASSSSSSSSWTFCAGCENGDILLIDTRMERSRLAAALRAPPGDGASADASGRTSSRSQPGEQSRGVLSVCYDPDERTVLTLSENNAVELRDIRGFGAGRCRALAPIRRLDYRRRLNAATVDTCDSPRLFLAQEDGGLGVYSARTLAPLRSPLRSHFAPCTAVAIDPTERYAMLSAGLFESGVLRR